MGVSKEEIGGVVESQLILGDSLEELKKLDADSVDLLCTDPPYGYGFMGKSWDKMLPPKEIFEESLRVLKPGSFAFVMSAPRSDVQYRMVQMLEDVGFEIGFTPIYWTYATGFPKALNIGKAVDKRGGRFMGDFIEHAIETAKKKGITKKELSMLFPSKKTGKPTGWLWNKQKTQGLTIEQFNTLVDYLDLSGYEFLQEAKREVIGTKSSGLGSGETYAFTDDNDKFKGEVDITIPKTDKAKELDGSYAGYQPKPAVEVVIVAMKPLDQKGYVDQALHNGKGVTWLDDCRIPFAGMDDQEQFDKDNVAAMMNFDGKYEKGEGKMYEGGWEKPNREGLSRGIQASRKTTKRKPREENTVFKTSGFKSENNDTAEASPLGRFPANLLVQDDVLNDGEITKSVARPPRECKNPQGNTFMIDKPTGQEHSDSGSKSRYYDLDAWWGDRVKKLPEEVKRTFPFLIVPKASKSEKNMGLENNIHPTVKPIQLFSYLVTLGSRKNDVVLDPFAGSGTTGIASVMGDRKYICIEREKEYFEIMEARVKKAINPANLIEHDFF